MALKKINYNGSSKVILRLCEMVNQLIDGGGGGSKHTIINSSGTSMTDRDGLQFTGATVTDDSVNNRTVVGIPTKLSDFTNDSGFITNTVNNLTNYYLKSETYTQAEVNALISSIVTLNILVVQTLPTQDISTTTIYLVPKQAPETQDIYDEYIYVNNAWEHIGTTQIDLSNYYTKSEINTLLADKVDKVAGKQLSTEDFTSALKTKLDGIASGAEVNVQSDWSQSDNTADDFIKNKPTIPSVSWTQIQASGTKIAEIDINGTSQDVYAPTGSGGNPTASDVTYDNTETEIPETNVQGAIDLAFATIDNQNDVLEGLVNPTFTEAQTRTNVASGDSYQTLWGKVKKWFTDLPSMFVSKSGDTMTGDLTLGKASTILKLRASGSRYTNITSAATGSDKDIELPNKSGTVALTSDVGTKLDASRINFSAGTFNGDVLDAAKTMADGSIAFYRSSNNPANCPTDCKWGAYMFIKTGGNTMIIYMDNNHIATAYGISSTHTSITWHIS